MTFEQLLALLMFGLPVPPEMIDPRFPSFLQSTGGLILTLFITALSLIVGAVLGTVLALGRRRGAADGLARRAQGHVIAVFVEVVRGLPIMLLVLLIFYMPYRLTEVRVPSFVLATGAFSLYAGIYFSEILRAGFRSVDSELRQVGRVLGLTRWQIIRTIELPIVCRTMLPDFINLAVTVFKDTSTLAIVAVPELTYVARQMLTSEPINYELALVLLLILYWLPATGLSMIATRAERWRATLQAEI